MRLIVLDTETTGLSPAEGRIVEIAAVEMLNGKLTGREFHHLLNPEHPISEEITEITGINDAMVAGKPTFADIAQAFIDFVGNDKLVVHNAKFDRAFLDFEFFNIDLVWCLRSKHQIIAFAARATDAKIVSALLCQTNGFGSWLWRSMYCRMACSNSPMLVWALRLIHLSLI